jgi:hypothetical protein
VFGNLPDTRPGTRSPRRRSGDGSKEAPPAPKPKAQAQPEATPQPPKREPSGQPADSPQPAPPGARSEGIGNIEDLAWAGVAAAAEAATLGVRLASRALDALRGSPERD